MAEVFDMAVIRDRIRKRMDELGMSKHKLSVQAGLGATAVRDIIDYETGDVKGSTLVKIADVLQTTVDDLTSLEPPVYLVGKIGAGGSILYEEESEHEEVRRPPLAAGRFVAFKVEGDSMLPRYESGDIIYIRRDHDGVLPEYLGYHCAVHTADGGTFLKVLDEGSEKGRYTLRSHNAAPMKDVEVVWAAPVRFVLPRTPKPENL